MEHKIDIINTDRDHGVLLRAFVLVISLGGAYFALYWLQPLMVDYFRPLLKIHHKGLSLFFNHVFFYSLPFGLSCFVLRQLLVEMDILSPLGLKVNFVNSLRDGIVGGLVVIGLFVMIWVAMGKGFKLHMDPYSAAGNIFSNFYEELAYRGLVFSGLLFSLRWRWLAVVLSGVAFAYTHSSYPFFLQAGVAAAGMVFSVAYLRTKNLFAPWLAHEFSDVILDAILKM